MCLPIRHILERRPMTTIRTGFLVAALALLPACATDLDVKTLDPPEPRSVSRQLECTETAADGVTCNKKQCKASPDGPAVYCDTYAYYCVKAGHKWEGTKIKGTCTRTHPD